MKEIWQQKLDFLMEIDTMKSIYRRTLVADGSRRETDAEHSWHVAVMAMSLLDQTPLRGLDGARIVRMLLVHDLVEVYAGDTFAYDEAGYADKAQREQAAADRLFALLPSQEGAEYRALWEEFDAMQTPDAQFAAAIDRLQPFLNNMRTQGHTWEHGKVRRAQVERRLQPVTQVFPQMEPMLRRQLDEAVQAGWLGA